MRTTLPRSSPAASNSAWPSPAQSPSVPDVLLRDEPTGALDYATGKIVLEAIASINRDLGTTTVVITHNAPMAQMADRVSHLADGCIGGGPEVQLGDGNRVDARGRAMQRTPSSEKGVAEGSAVIVYPPDVLRDGARVGVRPAG